MPKILQPVHLMACQTREEERQWTRPGDLPGSYVKQGVAPMFSSLKRWHGVHDDYIL